MGEVVSLIRGRAKRGKKIPKPVDCKDCGDPIETARLQALIDGVMRCQRCISCQRAYERRFDRQMDAVREWQTIEIIR